MKRREKKKAQQTNMLMIEGLRKSTRTNYRHAKKSYMNDHSEE